MIQNYTKHLLLTLVFFLGYIAAPAQNTYNGTYNFSTFPTAAPTALADWKAHNSPQYYKHPEFGIMPEYAPDEACVEVLEKRTAHERFFVNIHNPNLTYLQKSYGVINEWKDGYWHSVRSHIRPTQKGVYESRSQIATTILHTQQQNTSFSLADAQLFFNNWIILVQKNQQTIKSAKANWSQVEVGNDGAFVSNIFDGIDAEIIILHGKVKTNFIIRANRFGVYDELVFRDRFKGNKTIQFEFENDGKQATGIDNVVGYMGEKAVLEIGMAHAYIQGQMEQSVTTMPYGIADNQLDVKVPYQWIVDNIGKGSLVIDPMVSTTATKVQSTITGSKYGATCFTEYCSYNLAVPTPISATIADIKFTFNYLANAPCAVKDGGFSLHYSTCRSPAIAGVHFCNLPDGGICNAENVSIYGAMNACVDEVYCTPTDLNFEMRFYRCVQNTAGCGGACVGAASDWIMTIYANSLEKTPPILTESTICQGGTVSGTVAYSNGAEPYTHVWSMYSDGSSPLATGSTVSLTVPGSGMKKVYVKTTDACGLIYMDSVSLMVNPSYNIIEYDTVCQLSLPLIWNGITVYYGGPSAATKINTTSLGCDSNIVLNLTVINTITAIETINICPEMLPYTWNGRTVTTGGYAAARDTTISTVSGCDSITRLDLIITPTITVTTTIHICDDALPYTWNGFVLTTGGSGVAMYPSSSVVSGCDSNTTLNLVVHTPVTNAVTAYFCTGGSYAFGTSIYTIAGTYTHTFVSMYGCDSTVNLTLIQSPMDTVSIYGSKCRMATYDFYGTDLSLPGTYFYTDLSGACDEVIRLVLSNYDTLYTYSYYTICFGDSIDWSGTALTTSGTYNFTGVNSGGCDSIHTISLTVIPPDTFDLYEFICPFDTFDFYGTDVYLEGTYYHTEYAASCFYTYRLILTHADTLRTYDWEYICSGGSVSYGGMTITAAGTYDFVGVNATGCDTIFTLYVYVDPPSYDYTYETICNSQVYDFFDSSYNTSGVYYHSSASGCDTTWVLYLTVIDTIRTYYTTNICEGDAYIWKGISYTTSGSYPLMGTTPEGCDTLHTIAITVSPADTFSRSDTICPTATYDFYGMALPGTGTYIFVDTVGQCDTIWRLYLTMMDTITTSYTQTFCTGNSYTWKGINYTTSGDYYLGGVNDIGCDTIHALHLTFTPPDTVVTNDTICAGINYYFHGSYYNATGIYYYTTAIWGCEISYQLNLHVNDTIRSFSNDTICSGTYLEFGGAYLMSSGSYYFHGNNSMGCDTLRTINLHVNPPYFDSLAVTICPGESYNFFGIIYSTAGTYTRSSIAEGCDTAYILTLTIPTMPNLHDTFEICAGTSIVHDGTTLTTSGVYPYYYTSVDGCDSNYIITLIVIPYIDQAIAAGICENLPYSFFDSIIYDPGVYYHLVDDPECDTLYTLTLTHYPTYRQEQTLTLCNNDLPYSHLGMSIPYGSSTQALFDSVLLSSSHECDSLIIMNIIINDTSRTDLDTLVCYGTVFTFGSHTISNAGDYTDIYKNTIGCDSVVVLEVNYTPAPIITDSAMTACYSVTYNGTVFYESANFVDTFRDNISCDSLYRFVDITVLREPHDTMYAAICQGQTYEFNGKSYSNAITVTETFIYHNGCDSTITLHLSINPLPTMTLTAMTAEDISCILDSIRLVSTGADHYKVYDAFHKILGENTEVMAVLPRNSNQFTVIGQNEFGCIDSTSIVVNAMVCCDVLIPNSFSPNGDGLNDAFGPVTLGTPEHYKFQIFDRWGEMIYISFKPAEKWNGKYKNGEDADMGTYFYILTGNCYDGRPLQMKGDVTLIR